MSLAGRTPDSNFVGLSAHDASAQETMAFLLRLRARGISDLDVLRALELTPRLAFVPHRYADLALRDMALPIPCGQVMSEPFALAKILEALKISHRHRVLEIGAGSGYGTALLARLASEVLSFERYKTLALEADLRLRGLGVANAAVVWGDGLGSLEAAGIFDRILVDGIVAIDHVQGFIERLSEGGILVVSTLSSEGRPRLTRIAHVGGEFIHSDLGPSFAAHLEEGLARAI